MISLADALQCPDDEAPARWALRQSLEQFGAYWAQDFDRTAAQCDDLAANLPLNDQPKFAFLRGQATVYRLLASNVRAMAAANAAVIERIKESHNQGDSF